MISSDLMISDGEVADLIAPLSSSENSKTVFARAALSHLAEPGDRVAGRLVGQIGAVETLALLVHRADHRLVADRYPKLASELAHDFNADFGKIWNDATSRWQPRMRLDEVRKNLKSFALTNGKLLEPESHIYPPQLHDLADSSPLLLWLRGNPEALVFETGLAVVGSRITTGYGAQVSADIAEVCADRRVTTVSGGAFGIDTLVHRASLELESPTLAILAGGLDRLYPRGNAPLFEQILRNNAIIAEVPPGVAPAKWRFLMRNRLIAAFGNATVVVEAGSRSGSMSTAGHALELGRNIGVVPGRLYDSSSRGCLNLLRNHAGQVEVLTCPEDVIELAGLSNHRFELRESMGALETRALDTFGKRTLNLLDVQRIAGLTFSETQLAIGRLELDGYIERQVDGYRRVHHNLET